MWGSRKPKILIKGSLMERPWAATLATIAVSELTGQLALTGDGMDFQLAFAGGKLVGAVSPAASDSLQRIALASHAAPPPHIAGATRIVGRTDDIAKFADSAGLVGADGAHFKRRVIVQRAARTFSIERGDFVVSDRITIPVSGVEVDVCAAIYRGMRANLSELRLSTELRAQGARFILFPEAEEHVARFDFDPEAEAILEALRAGTSAAELEARFRALDSRLILAVLGSLAVCRIITPIAERTQDLSIVREPTPRAPTISRVPAQPTAPSPARPEPPAARRIMHDVDTALTPVRAPALSVEQIDQLLASRIALLEAGADLFTFLGVPFDAPASAVRDAYLELARYLRPDHLVQIGIHDRRHEARTVFAQVVTAMTVLSDAARRADYLASLGHRA